MALTKEEKKAKKEAKRLEKLRLEVELKKKMRRDELQREIAAQALKRGELDKSWRQMMFKIKEPLFRQDIEVMWHTFERAYDKKDYAIQYMMKLIDVADDQFQRTIASFCDTIDTMINKFLSDLEEMAKDNERRTAELIKWGEDIATKIMSDHNAAELHLQLLIFHGHTTADNYAWNTRGENMVKEDEERTKCSNEREDLRSILENIFNSMWDEYKAVLKAYVLGTAENQKAVRKLRLKENLMADIIATQAKKIANSDGILKRLRTELIAYESGTKQIAFRERRNRHRAACFKLKQCLLAGCATDEKQLATLVNSSDVAVEWMEAAHKKAEKILRLSALCRKFETQREKVLPFGSDIPHSPICDKSAARRQQSDESFLTNAVNSTCGLIRLWQRIAKAELAKRALFREKMLLEQENDLIVKKVQSFRDRGVSGVKASQCLCGKTGKTPLLYRPVAVEGVLEINKYRKQW